jgi:class 3 adenylate cyclase
VEDIRYAKAGTTHVAYRVIEGSGPAELVMVSGAFFPCEILYDDRVVARFIDGLASLGRLVVFDKRGVGLSDPFTDWSRPVPDQWAEDLLAVVDDAGLERPTVVSWEIYGVARAAAAMRPDRLGGQVLINPLSLPEVLAPDIKELDESETIDRIGEVTARQAFPSRIAEPAFQDWITRAGRLGASPASARRLWHQLFQSGPLTPPGITVPTLIVHNRDCMVPDESIDEVRRAIPGAEAVDLPGVDVYPIAGDVDAMVAEIALFLTGEVSLPAPDRTLAAVLFTDLVGSTERAVDEGDRRWRDLLDSHDGTIRRCVGGHAGRVVKTTGDGVLAVMPSVTSALDAARDIGRRLTDDSLSIRAGVHVGDIDERADGDVSGLAVNIAARIMGEGGPGEIVVSEAARQATLGSRLRFVDARTVEWKGVPESWTIHRLEH